MKETIKIEGWFGWGSDPECGQFYSNALYSVEEVKRSHKHHKPLTVELEIERDPKVGDVVEMFSQYIPSEAEAAFFYQERSSGSHYRLECRIVEILKPEGEK